MCSIPIPLRQKILILLFTPLFLTSAGCTSWFPILSTVPIDKRIDGTVLIIGCVIIESAQYQYRPVHVVLGYQPLEEEGEKLEQIWAETDSTGYFVLTNMPAGHYTISGVRQDGELNSIVYTYRDRSKTWDRSKNNFEFPFSMKPEIWPEMHEGGIFDFGYLILTYEVKRATPAHIVNAYNFQSLEGQQFLSREEYYRPPVPQHFIEKYPDSEWAPYLRRITP